MKAYLIYRPDSEDEAKIRDFVRRCEEAHVPVEKLNIDSPEGQQKVELYDLIRHPALLVVRDDGAQVKKWIDQFPKPGDLDYYLHS